jgi:hypothetical protein
MSKSGIYKLFLLVVLPVISIVLLGTLITVTKSLPGDPVIPVKQVVVYRPQSASYNNFGAAIFAQGQLGESSSLPVGSKIIYYIDSDKATGPLGAENGARCSASDTYYHNTITLDERFCPDFNNAILDNTSVYGMVPTEAIFLHQQNGERCWWANNGGADYLINPASTFYKNYFVNRSLEKLQEHGLTSYFLDDIQNGWGVVTDACLGVPQEYADWNSYSAQMNLFALYVKDNLPGYFVTANLTNPGSDVWDTYTPLDGAMCESCFSNWGGAWPSAANMLITLDDMDRWINVQNNEAYIVIQPPDNTAASNLFTFAATLLVAADDGQGVYFHFGADYNIFYSIPEYSYDLGLPTSPYSCNGYVCTRLFEKATVEVDFTNHIGSITLTTNPTATPGVTSTPTTAPTSTLTPVPTSTTGPTATSIPTSTPTSIPTATLTSLPTSTPTRTPIPTNTRTTAPTQTKTPTVTPTNTPTLSITNTTNVTPTGEIVTSTPTQMLRSTLPVLPITGNKYYTEITQKNGLKYYSIIKIKFVDTNNNVLPNLSVTLDDIVATTDANGIATFKDIKVGGHTIKNNGSDKTQTITIPEPSLLGANYEMEIINVQTEVVSEINILVWIVVGILALIIFIIIFRIFSKKND